MSFRARCSKLRLIVAVPQNLRFFLRKKSKFAQFGTFPAAHQCASKGARVILNRVNTTQQDGPGLIAGSRQCENGKEHR